MNNLHCWNGTNWTWYTRLGTIVSFFISQFCSWLGLDIQEKDVAIIKEPILYILFLIHTSLNLLTIRTFFVNIQGRPSLINCAPTIHPTTNSKLHYSLQINSHSQHSLSYNLSNLSNLYNFITSHIIDDPHYPALHWRGNVLSNKSKKQGLNLSRS